MSEEPEETPDDAPVEGTDEAVVADADAPPTQEDGSGGAAAPSAVDVPASSDAEPSAALTPKERRAAARAAKAPATRPSRTIEELAAERASTRSAKAAERRRVRARARAKHAAAPKAAPAAVEAAVGKPRVQQGVVVSDKPDKTIVVRIDVARRHRRYGKVVRSSATLHAHDENNDAGAGDTVTVIESRPLSRTKRWRLVGVVEKAK